eukprot:gnl/TRDRNA2_/TRDRNA2_117413_c0_seq2.p1 gnl/TRDRNA2_/TRDRNA2_117413_c0~~gnl/TRDRNA2_/TRDRNA2_117413_c0_seq2.p1  ORF type:complete len:826 (+),score=186.34 gnl/TRDRNA2_/TRDRNA2_117413_c0_seq2:100-2577(+)
MAAPAQEPSAAAADKGSDADASFGGQNPFTPSIDADMAAWYAAAAEGGSDDEEEEAEAEAGAEEGEEAEVAEQDPYAVQEDPYAVAEQDPYGDVAEQDPYGAAADNEAAPDTAAVASTTPAAPVAPAASTPAIVVDATDDASAPWAKRRKRTNVVSTVGIHQAKAKQPAVPQQQPLTAVRQPPQPEAVVQAAAKPQPLQTAWLPENFSLSDKPPAAPPPPPQQVPSWLREEQPQLPLPPQVDVPMQPSWLREEPAPEPVPMVPARPSWLQTEEPQQSQGPSWLQPQNQIPEPGANDMVGGQAFTEIEVAGNELQEQAEGDEGEEGEIPLPPELDNSDLPWDHTVVVVRGGQVHIELQHRNPPMLDEVLLRFCDWLDQQLPLVVANFPYVKKSGAYVDVSDNVIGPEGLDKLFRVLRDHRVPCLVLKAYRNTLDDSIVDTLIEYLYTQPESFPMHGIHISHNTITDKGAFRLIRAAAQCGHYPRERTRLPLWLRLESNEIKNAQKVVADCLEENFNVCLMANGLCSRPDCNHYSDVHVQLPYFFHQGPKKGRGKGAPAEMPMFAANMGDGLSGQGTSFVARPPGPSKVCDDFMPVGGGSVGPPNGSRLLAASPKMPSGLRPPAPRYQEPSATFDDGSDMGQWESLANAMGGGPSWGKKGKKGGGKGSGKWNSGWNNGDDWNGGWQQNDDWNSGWQQDDGWQPPASGKGKGGKGGKGGKKGGREEVGWEPKKKRGQLWEGQTLVVKKKKDVKLGDADKVLGFTWEMAGNNKKCPRVKSVDPGSMVGASARVGDALLRINGLDCGMFNETQIAEMMKSRPLSLRFGDE